MSLLEVRTIFLSFIHSFFAKHTCNLIMIQMCPNFLNVTLPLNCLIVIFSMTISHVGSKTIKPRRYMSF